MNSRSNSDDPRVMKFTAQVDENHKLQRKITTILRDKFIEDIREFYVQFGPIPYAQLTSRNSFYISQHHLKAFLKTWLTEAARNAFEQGVSTFDIDRTRVGKEHLGITTIAAINSGWYTNVHIEDLPWSPEPNLVTAVIEIGCYFNPPLIT